MRSLAVEKLFNRAIELTDSYCKVKITDGWEQRDDYQEIKDDRENNNTIDELTQDKEDDHGEFEFPIFTKNDFNLFQVNTKHTEFKNKQDWINHGNSVRCLRGYNKFDCVSVMATLIKDIAENLSCPAKIEIINTGNPSADSTLLFIAVNRKGPLKNIKKWGEDAFIMDIWFRNQLPGFSKKGAFWVNDELQFNCFFNNAYVQRSPLFFSVMCTILDTTDPTDTTDTTNTAAQAVTTGTKNKMPTRKPEVIS
ncbi:MAG: hypothetical protein KAH18_01880 [Psychromonas sp.]|nr:hypothetical protein [Psychromonas sp.]